MKTPYPHDRVLIVYDSRLGSTAEVAAHIGSVLAEQGASVDVVRIDRVNDLGQYDHVVIGSAIRYDCWLPEATAFVEANRDALSRVPVALFFTCLALAGGSAKGERKAAGYAGQLRQLLPDAPDIQIGGFAGVLDPSRGPWWTRVLLRVISRVSGVAPGDYRDWHAIRTWTHQSITLSAGITTTPKLERENE